jgi:hypothetical protein
MSDRFCLKALLLAGLFLPIVSCSNTSSLASIVITPEAYTITLASNGYGGYWSYAATGYYGHADHQITKDVTKEVTWTSLAPIMVTIVSGGTNAGVATPTGQATGTSSIYASAPGFNGTIKSNESTFTVQLPTTTTTAQNVTSLSIGQSSQTAASPNVAEPFAVTGKTSEGGTVNVTDHLSWTSSNPQAVAIDKHTGAIKVLGAGETTISVVFTNPDGSMAMGTKSMTVEK